MWTAVLLTCVLTYVIYYVCFKPYNYWKNRGIVYEVPLPIVGNFGRTIFKRKHPAEVYGYLYTKYPEERYVGIYVFMKPALLLRDLNLIRKICQEEFDHFSDRVDMFDIRIDDILGNSLACLKGNKWRDGRKNLNSLFDESLVKNFFERISDCAEAFTEHFAKEEQGLLEIQLKDAFSRYDCDVISKICFGITENSLENGNNKIFKIYNELKHFGPMERLKLSLIQLCPLLSKVLQMKVFPTSKTDFYKKLVLQSLQKDQSENKTSKHYLNYIAESRNEISKSENTEINERADNSSPDRKQEWTEEELAAQAMMFLNAHAGIETFLSASSFLAYELASNPPIQVKLQEEIDKVQTAKENKVTYEALSQMKYFECVVSESLRKWPPVYQTDRKCVKNFYEVELSVPDEDKIVIEKNTAIIIPIMAIHRDPKYYLEPEKFIPERFCNENEDKVIPGTYLPFGMGPRKCIGSNLALLQLKLLFFHLLSKFDLVTTINTKLVVEDGPWSYDVNAAINTVLGLKPRKVTSL